MRKLEKRLIRNIVFMFIIIFMSSLRLSANECIQDKKYIYLTFDDGPSEYTEELLDILDKYNIKATFFMLKDEMMRYPESVKRILNEGHAVGVHGVTHEKSNFYKDQKTPLNEMNEANITLRNITGYSTQFIRTPYGSVPYLTKEQENNLRKEGYIIWDWNIDSKDWCYRNPSKSFNEVKRGITSCTSGTKVVLLHDIKFACETMELIANWMNNSGYTSKVIDINLTPVRLINYKKIRTTK